jgi:hypothetical protein
MRPEYEHQAQDGREHRDAPYELRNANMMGRRSLIRWSYTRGLWCVIATADHEAARLATRRDRHPELNHFAGWSCVRCPEGPAPELCSADEGGDVEHEVWQKQTR